MVMSIIASYAKKGNAILNNIHHNKSVPYSLLEDFKNRNENTYFICILNLTIKDEE